MRVVALTLSILLLLACPVRAETVSSDYLVAWHEAVVTSLDESLETQNELLRQQTVALEDVRQRISDAERSRSSREALIRSLSIEEQAVLVRVGEVEARISRIERQKSLVDRMLSEGLSSHNLRAVRHEGAVLAGSEENRVPIEDSAKLEGQTWVETGSDGFVEIISTDGSLIKIGPSSLVSLVTEGDGTRYVVEQGQLHGSFTCIEMDEIEFDERDCRSFVIAADQYRVGLSEGEVSYQLQPNGERRYYVVDGAVDFSHGEEELPEIPMNNMITVDPGGQIHGPMQLNFRWMPAWWRRYE